MQATTVLEPTGTENDYHSPSEVFEYANKLVEKDLAAAVRIFRKAPPGQAKSEKTQQETTTA